MNVEQAFDGLRASIHAVSERMYENLSRANADISEMTVAGISDDGGVEVVIASDKWVRRVSIDPKAYEKYDETSLGKAVVEACTAAKENVNRAAWSIIDRVFEWNTQG